MNRRTQPRHRRRPAAPARTRPWGMDMLSRYIASHAQAMLASLGRIMRTPLSNALTILVIAIALALPGTLLVLLDNLERVTGDWHAGASITMFMQADVSTDTARGLGDRLVAEYPGIARVSVQSPQQAMAEFRQLSGFGGDMKSLDRNPLPATLILTLRPEHSGAAAAARLATELQKLEETDLVQVDLEWLERLEALMQLGKRGVLAMALLLGIGVLLVIGNTIRLEIQNRREEIEIVKLVGGTSAFVRRPFLYTGLWYGLLGSASAWLLVAATVWALDPATQRLAGLYDSDFRLSGLAIGTGLRLLLTGAGLGLLGALLAVGQHLRRIEPG